MTQMFNFCRSSTARQRRQVLSRRSLHRIGVVRQVTQTLGRTDWQVFGRFSRPRPGWNVLCYIIF